ncbi:MAG: helix-turn-helix domain-containing protein [Streptococcaceae bacterium]|jgi:DNA-binding transcriptional regulator YiaG|nr:helix-turn-helix domain-containing protein [Streptococcaceae bacterium]
MTAVLKKVGENMLILSKNENPLQQTPYYKEGMAIQEMLDRIGKQPIDLANDFSIPKKQIDNILVGRWSDPFIYRVILKSLEPEYKQVMKKRRLSSAQKLYEKENGRIINSLLIKQIRLYSEMTQKEFAQLLFLDVQTVKNWESGRTKPNPQAELLLRLILEQRIDPKDLAKTNETISFVQLEN